MFRLWVFVLEELGGQMKKEGFFLNNGREIPPIGFGTCKMKDGEGCIEKIQQALRIGYRHIDTAFIYKNEKSVGEGIRKSGVARDEIFLTSKLWNTDRGYRSAKVAIKESLSRLKTDYLDLYLIHWPIVEGQSKAWKQENLDTWKALEEAYQEGVLKAIGVSNFKPHHLEPLMKSEVRPMVNQIEVHPGQMQEETLAYCKQNDVIVEGWGPLGRGLMLEKEELKKIGTRHQKSVAQVCIRWALQNGVLPLPKTENKERMQENLQVFDFALSQKEMEEINAFAYFGGSGLDPDRQEEG